MSFILEALRKAEHDRHREKGPALAEVAVAQTPSKKNVWATVAVALLVVNLVAVGALLIRRAGSGSSDASLPGQDAAAATHPAAGAPPNAKSTGAGSGPSPATASGLVEPDVAAPAYSTAPSGSAAYTRPPSTLPPVLQPALPADGAGGSRNPLADELSDAGMPSAGYDPGYEEDAGYPTAPPGYTSGVSGITGTPPKKRGTVVYERLPEADPITSPENAAALARAEQEEAYSRPARGTQPGVAVSETPASTLPTAEEIGPQAGLPDLNLNLHVWSTKPDERIVFVNSRRYKEGDTLEEGPHVDKITKDGVELSYRGNRFALPRQ